MRKAFITATTALLVLANALPVVATPVGGKAMGHMKKGKALGVTKKAPKAKPAAKGKAMKKKAPAAKPKPAPKSTPKPAAGPATTHVVIKNFAFTVPSVTVKKGDIVHFMNQDSAPHTVTAVDALFQGSETLNNGGTFGLNTATLAPGTYEYFCNFHPSMKGTIIVQ
ncbi:cupredoxin domain-containing protein [Candidatus Uhrbacteria bacterium]|nr:cupredoxin domain-containing protein [Candidatus Uhrbacteria bacterium]